MLNERERAFVFVCESEKLTKEMGQRVGVNFIRRGLRNYSGYYLSVVHPNVAIRRVALFYGLNYKPG